MNTRYFLIVERGSEYVMRYLDEEVAEILSAGEREAMDKNGFIRRTDAIWVDMFHAARSRVVA